MDANKFKANLAQIKKHGEGFRLAVQKALVHAAYHAQIHGNVEPVAQIFAALGRGVNLKPISLWVTTYSPVYFKNGLPVLAKDRQKGCDHTPETLETALMLAPHWYQLEREQRPTNPWDSEKELAHVLKFLDAAIKKASSNDPALEEVLSKIAAGAHAAANRFTFENYAVDAA